MEIAMKERLLMAKNKEQVHSDGTMDEFMKDNSKMAWCMETANFLSKIKNTLKGNSLKTGRSVKTKF